MNDQLLSVQDLVRMTGWSPFTIYKKSAAGEIPGRLKIGKNSLRFRASEVEAWLLKENSEHQAAALA
jgi:predicted DNA-binding transcriptional regulator AlpA